MQAVTIWILNPGDSPTLNLSQSLNPPITLSSIGPNLHTPESGRSGAKTRGGLVGNLDSKNTESEIPMPQ